MKKIFFSVAMESIAEVSTIIMTITPFQIDTPRHAFAAASNNQTSPPLMAMNHQTSNKTFYLFTTEIPGFRETEGVKEAGLPSDQFSLQTILVRTGDDVSVNFYNLDTIDRHSFTIDAPYNVNIDLAPGQNGTAHFIANHAGIFKFYCKYHLPSMIGQLDVLS